MIHPHADTLLSSLEERPRYVYRETGMKTKTIYLKSLTIVLTLVLSALSVNAADKIAREKFKSEGKDRTYYIFVPASVKPGTPVPLLITLHGSRRNGLSLVEKWKELAD